MSENNCSEQASRMQAMENSTKNASEMLEKLTLSYNRCPGFIRKLLTIMSLRSPDGHHATNFHYVTLFITLPRMVTLYLMLLFLYSSL